MYECALGRASRKFHKPADCLVKAIETVPTKGPMDIEPIPTKRLVVLNMEVSLSSPIVLAISRLFMPWKPPTLQPISDITTVMLTTSVMKVNTAGSLRFGGNVYTLIFFVLYTHTGTRTQTYIHPHA